VKLEESNSLIFLFLWSLSIIYCMADIERSLSLSSSDSRCLVGGFFCNNCWM